MICIQLPTGKTAWVDPGWWLSLSDDQIESFYERNVGSEADPLSQGIPKGQSEIDDLIDSTLPPPDGWKLPDADD